VYYDSNETKGISCFNHYAVFTELFVSVRQLEPVFFLFLFTLNK
jgi:hypothetical protein